LSFSFSQQQLGTQYNEWFQMFHNTKFSVAWMFLS
jgi:hypothetical protein